MLTRAAKDRRQLAQAAPVGLACPQLDLGRCADLQSGEMGLGQGDRHLAFAVARHAEYGLSRRDHLSRLGKHRRDHARRIRDQRRVGSLIFCQLRLRFRRVRRGFLGIERRLADEVLLPQLLRTLQFGGCQRAIRLGLGRRELLVGGIEPRKYLPRFHAGTDIDQALDQLATDAEAQRRFDARTHFAAVTALLCRLASADFQCLDELGPGIDGFCRRRFFAAGRQQGKDAQPPEFHLPASLAGATESPRSIISKYSLK
jgi:hypothetical protein